MSWFVVLALAGGGIYWLGSRDSTSADAEAQARTEKDEKLGAWVIAQQFVEEELKAPGTASFGGKDVQPEGAGRYRVSGWVDAQNGFGAKVRSRFSITVEKIGDQRWKPVDGPTLSAW